MMKLIRPILRNCFTNSRVCICFDLVLDSWYILLRSTTYMRVNWDPEMVPQ
jgi:hypothetical protein